MIYLDNAATSFPKPSVVKEAVMSAMDMCGNPGRSGHALAIHSGKLIYSGKKCLCDLLNIADYGQVAFCLNCTDALNMAIFGSDITGQHVITTVWEHNSVLRPLHYLAKHGIISYDAVLPQDMLSRIRGNTGLAIITHVSNVTGAVMPLKDLIAGFHSRGIPVLIDGAQAVGHMDVDMQELDCELYAFPGHKGLLSPMGVGGLYVKEGYNIKPYRLGGTGSISHSLAQPDYMPDMLESGTPPTHAIAGLMAGCRYISDSREKIFGDIRRNTRVLIEGLQCIKNVVLYSDKDALGIVAFNIAGMDSSLVADELANAGIATRGGLHCAPLTHRQLGTLDIGGVVRLSPGHDNTLGELCEVLDVIKRLAK